MASSWVCPHFAEVRNPKVIEINLSLCFVPLMIQWSMIQLLMDFLAGFHKTIVLSKQLMVLFEAPVLL